MAKFLPLDTIALRYIAWEVLVEVRCLGDSELAISVLLGVSTSVQAHGSSRSHPSTMSHWHSVSDHSDACACTQVWLLPLLIYVS